MPKVVSLLDDEDQEFGFDNDHEDGGRNWFDEDDNLDGSTVTAGDEDIAPIDRAETAAM